MTETTHAVRAAGRRGLRSAVPLPALASLLAALVPLPALAQPAPAPVSATVSASAMQTLGERANFQDGAFTGYVQPFNAGKLRPGDGRQQSMAVAPGRFPAGTVFSHAWPASYPCPAGVWGFNAVSYGNYYGTTAKAPIAPKRVREIETLTQAVDIAMSGDARGFNAIFDAFLTRDAGDFTHRVIELDVQLHASDIARAFIRKLTDRGTWNDPGGTAWRIYTDPKTTAPVVLYALPDQDVTRGTLDVGSLLKWMTAAGIITGDEWYNGHALGSEPVQGAGALTLNTVAVTYR